MLDDHHPVGVAMAPAFVPAVIAMLAELGACADTVMVAVAVETVMFAVATPA